MNTTTTEPTKAAIKVARAAERQAERALKDAKTVVASLEPSTEEVEVTEVETHKVKEGFQKTGKAIADFNLRKIGRGFKALGSKLPKIEVIKGSNEVEDTAPKG